MENEVQMNPSDSVAEKVVKKTSVFKEYSTPIAVLVAGAMIAGAVMFKDKAPRGAGVAPLVSPLAQDEVAGVEVGSLPTLGTSSAKVTMVEFGDYQCPFCGRFFQAVEPTLLKDYVSTGKVRFAFRDFAFLGPESVWSAEAARCANEQGKFWEYHNYLYSHQKGENQGAFAKENLKKFARTLGLNGSIFDKCLDSEKYKAAVQNDTEQGSKYGVSGTPTSFVNGKKLVGALPYEQIQAVIEGVLK